MSRRVGHGYQVGSWAKAGFASGPAADDLERLTQLTLDAAERSMLN
jgi:hypothetical protein